MLRLIDSLGQAVTDGLEETQMLAKTLISRSQDVLTYFDRSGTSNGPTPSHQQTPRGLFTGRGKRSLTWANANGRRGCE